MKVRELAFAAGLLIAVIHTCSANFVEGDFVPMSRKAQFHKRKTQWHDVLGAHCPKFGVERTVAMPIPQPIGFDSADEYKIQLSLDGERLVTPWLEIIGRRAPSPPFLQVHLTRSGDALVAVSAAVVPLTGRGSGRHGRLAADFANATLWPKHLMVRYTWEARHETDVTRGLTVMLAAGGAAMIAVAASVARAHQRQLRQFVEDVAGDGGGMGLGGQEKAD